MTSTPKHCECGWLGICLNDPESPIGYDSHSNSFHIIGPNNGHWMLYYCPMCGGKFPDSNYQTDVPIAPKNEYLRLQNLTRGIHDPDTAIKQLGEPDYDGLMKTQWHSNGGFTINDNQPPIRNIEYQNLSQWYAVEFYFDQNEMETRIAPKPLNARQLEERFEVSESPNMPIVGDLDAEFPRDGNN